MLRYSILILYFTTLSRNNVVADEDVLLQLPTGTIRGRTRTTITGTTLYHFQGVPFAESPVNELRFQPPKPKSPWTGIWDATQERSYCYQMTSATSDGSEDCLFINIFTPEKPSLNGSLPVMFFIYGGGFIEGASVEINYGPDHFMDHGVIIVTFNYRVGPFGFFSTGDHVIPGNNGLKDQLLALKWTNQYIRYFGGDPKKITIFGQSAGAASVSYHILSPRSRGLFKSAICESGSALSAWAYQSNQREISYRLASFVNPSFASYNASSEEVHKYLMNVPAEVIDRAAYRVFKLENPADIQIVQGFYFAPVVEQEHEDAFITRPMHEILESGEINNVPLLSGVNTEESLFYKDVDLVKNPFLLLRIFSQKNHSVNNHILIKKVYKVGVRGFLLEWITYYTSNMMVVTLHNEVIDTQYISLGIPRSQTDRQNPTPMFTFREGNSAVHWQMKRNINMMGLMRGLHVKEKDKLTVARLIEKFYARNGSFLENERQLIRYFSDQSFARSIIEAARLQSKVGDVYFYQFAYHGVLGGQIDKSVVGFSEDVRHGEEISYLFRRNYGGLNTTDLTKYPVMDQLVQKRMIRMFTDFAKYSNPTPQKTDLLQNLTWPKVQPDNFQYMDIGSWLEIAKDPKDAMVKFWRHIFSKYGVQPFYTY